MVINKVDGFSLGMYIDECIANAIELAAGPPGVEPVGVEFEFNGVTIQVAHDSNHELIRRDTFRAMNGYIDKQVGPHPSEQLTEAEVVSDAAIEAKNEARRQQRQAEYDAKAKAKREATEARLNEAPPMEFSDEETWQTYVTANADDGYGAACVRYAEMWARLMQLEVVNGASVEDVAEATSHEADIEGITGFMYGVAVLMLSRSWIHGDQLRRWHNLKTQIGNEGERANESGGVLNPAVLSVQVD